MPEMSLLTILFKLINAAIVLFVLWYIYKNHVASSLKEAVNEHVQALKRLIGLVNANERTIEQLTNDTTIQKATIEDLHEKLSTWHSVAREQQQRMHNEQQHVAAIIEEKKIKQGHCLSHALIERAVLQHAIEAAWADLASKLSAEEKKQYVDSLVHMMDMELQK